MNRELNFFADEDVEVLRSLIAREKQRPLNAPYRNNPAPNTDQMPEVHVAKTTGLMPALEVHPTGQDEPGSALCTIYRLLEGKLWSLTIPTAVVYNLGSSAIPDGSWILVQRDRFGDWYVSERPATSEGGAEFIGIPFIFDSNTSDSDPSPGKFRLNNATQSNATSLFFDNETADGGFATNMHINFVAGVGLPEYHRGFIYLQQKNDKLRRQLWAFTSPTNGTGYYKYPVALMSRGPLDLQNGEEVYCLFVPNNVFSAHEEPAGISPVTYLKLIFPEGWLTGNPDGSASVTIPLGDLAFLDTVSVSQVSDFPSLGGLATLNAATDVDPLTDSSGGFSSTTLNAVSGTGDDTNINDNIASLNAKIDEIISSLQNAGIMAS